MTPGQGALMNFSCRQKLHVSSSTECELIVIDDAIPLMMWGTCFIEAQGYTVNHNILYQYNKLTILLATNGRSFSSKRTKHIHRWYFLIKDKLVPGDLKIKHAPTEEMWSDVLTKSQQGMLSKIMRDKLMNVYINYDEEVKRNNTQL